LISEPIIFGQSAIVQMVKTQTYFHCLLYLDSVKEKIIRSCAAVLYMACNGKSKTVVQKYIVWLDPVATMEMLD
jgi:hypothetical protein